MSAVTAPWETCSEEGCLGVQSDGSDRCLAHVAPDELETALTTIGRDGNVDVRGVAVSGDLLQRILDALPRTPEGHPRFQQADFRDATFKEHARFVEATFQGDAWFDRAAFESAAFGGATFGGYAWFEGATFGGEVAFAGATFNEDAGFRETVFGEYAGFDGATFRGKVSFGQATFQDNAGFHGATFKGAAAFDGATFEGNASFREATFEAEAQFGEATFKGDAQFEEAIFMRDARFDGATFTGNAWFVEATFMRDAWFDGATFMLDAWFEGATFGGLARFREATFTGIAWFDSATFTRDAQFRGATFTEQAVFLGATFAGDASFAWATFERTTHFGPTLVLRTLDFEGVSFLQTVDLDASANCLSLAKARFPAGARAGVRWAEIVMDDADFAQASILAGVPRFNTAFKERGLVRKLKRDGMRSKRSGRPRVVSLRRANVANLVLANVELRACRFVGAHNLDQLRIDTRSIFASSPSGLRATRRRTIAEEHEWRARWSNRWWRSKGWYPAESKFPESLGEAEQLDTDEVAGIYRELRKGREDSKNEPGAADFYYGEMEMRRFDQTKPRAERLILSLYWLVSGYGLRASRALLSLLVTIVVFGVLLYAWGFPSHQSFLDALTFSAQSTTSLFRAPVEPLTTAGEWLNMALRLLGPLFFGLALLSLRGRVKR